VACSGPAACIAVGTYAGTNGQGHTLAVAWNGTRWRILTTPGPGNSELTGIACSRPARCIAVGDTLTTGGRQTLAEAWNAGNPWRGRRTLRSVGPVAVLLLLEDRRDDCPHRAC
jgi:hypothetical protein